MHIFLKDLNGRSLHVPADSVADIKDAASLHCDVPVTEQRLVFGGRQLRAGQSLADAGIADGVTVTLALRLRGGAPKKRCACVLPGGERCTSAAVKYVGDCSYCQAAFCATHRLPEEHKCTGLASCRQEAFSRNKAKLEAEMTSSNKIESI